MSKANRIRRLKLERDPEIGIDFIDSKVVSTQSAVVDKAKKIFSDAFNTKSGSQTVLDTWSKASSLYPDPCLVCCFKHGSKMTLTDLAIIGISFKSLILSNFLSQSCKLKHPFDYKKDINPDLIPIVFSSIDLAILVHPEGDSLEKELPSDYVYELTAIKL